MKRISFILIAILFLCGQTTKADAVTTPRFTGLSESTFLAQVSPLGSSALKGSKPLSSQNPPLADQVLVRNERHLISVSYAAAEVTITLEALGDGTNNLGGQFPNVDFVSLRVDRDRNGKVDPCVDVAYGIAGGTRDWLCAQYLLSETSSTGCGGFASEATLSVQFSGTANGVAAYPVWTFAIPK